MPFLCTLASGSSGNSTLISDGRTHVLIDMGISLRQLGSCLSRFALTPGDLSAVLVTHEHNDHVKGLEVLCRRTAVPVYASQGTYFALGAGVKSRVTPFNTGGAFGLGGLWVDTFKTPHDSADSCGFRIEGKGLSVGYMTDSGHVPPHALDALSGASHIVLESNHDVPMLRKGPYPAFLKKRILSPDGHLSNADAAQAAAYLAKLSTKSFTLAHLSRENNLPGLAFEAVTAALAETGVSVQVAPEGMGQPVYFEEDSACWRSASFA